MSRILGIETSCDETGVALVEDGVRIRSNLVASQIALHAPFGGVVPELASRQHLTCISQLTARAIAESGGSIDAVAATAGPGLMGSLLVGVNFGKALAYGWKAPFLPVHHIEGHIYAAFLDERGEGGRGPEFPFLALVVSGGHTCLIHCRAPHQYAVLGTTRDDAVGECFDKVARLLGLGYPGGPAIQQAAENGNPRAFAFPRAMTDSDSLEFSYSGLKTAVLYTLRGLGAHPSNLTPDLIADIAASFQNAAVDILMIKTKLALGQSALPRLVVAGGAAANRLLRERLATEIDVPVHIPSLSLCADNGAMIAAAAQSRLEHGLVGSLSSSANSSLPLQ